MAESNTPRWPAYGRVPPFLPVPLRARADGWTPEQFVRWFGERYDLEPVTSRGWI